VNLLVLGGSIFVGRHIVVAAVERGHAVTMLSRGRHLNQVVDGVEHIIRDRRSDLTDLAQRRWDAVIDTCGYRPEVVNASVRAFQGSTDTYLFISSASVYPDFSQPDVDEESPTLSPTWDERVSARDPVGYGQLKVACEVEVRTGFSDRAVILRSGLIVGPGDPTNRFGYWPARCARPGPVLVHGPSNAPAQFVDVRDHAEFVLTLCATGTAGTFNVATPAGAMTMRTVLAACCDGGAADEIVWVRPSLLDAYFVRPWTELPLWVGSDESRRYMMASSSARAAGAGLRHRPLVETVRDTRSWELAQPIPFPRPGQLKSVKEQLLIQVAREEPGHRSD
jgi:2'-hydroxyisoflavone reductase